MINTLAELFTWYGTHRRKHLFPKIPRNYNAEGELVRFPSANSDGVCLSGWLLSVEKPRGVVLLVHGIDGNADELLPKAAMLQRNGYAALTMDLRANGRSEGKHGTLGYKEKDDVIGGVRFLQSHTDLKNYPIAALGESLGGASVILAAKETPEISAVIVESSFASLDDAIRRRLALTGYFAKHIKETAYRVGKEKYGIDIDAVNPAEAVGHLAPRPFLLIHDQYDILCPRVESDRLFAAAKEPKSRWDVPFAPHTYGYHLAPKAYQSRVLGFLKDALG